MDFINIMDITLEDMFLMILINHPVDGRKRYRGGLVCRLASAFLALIWTIALSFAASSLWADHQPPQSGGQDAKPAVSLPADSLTSGIGKVSVE